MTRLAGLAAVLAALTLAALGLGVSIARAMGDPFASWWFRGAIAASVPVYFLACRTVLRKDTKPALWLVLGVAIGLRAVLLLGPPLLSSDVYRYVWDGRVGTAGINPYLYLPVDPALAGLRDTAIYPHINRADYAPTIYPPVAQVIFAAVSSVSDSVIAMKAAMVAFEALAMFCLARILTKLGRPAAQILIYAWNPVALWEFAGNGHVDAAAIGLMALALLWRSSGARMGLAGLALGAATLVKFLPAMLAAALWRNGRPGLRLALGCLAVVVGLYGVYALWGGAGAHVLGFLGSYGDEEGLASGSGIWVLSGLGLLAELPGWASRAYLGALAVGLVLLGSWIAFRPRPQPGSPADITRFCSDAALLGVVVMTGLSPHYAWYFAWLAVPATIAPSRSAIWMSAAAMILYYSPLPDRFLWPSILYLPAVVLMWIDARSARNAALVPALQGSF
jgi:alpha-1,6-mannosyltransferase